MLYIGCNSDNDPLKNLDEIKTETKQVSKSVENNIDSLFYNYVNSFEYKESKRLLNIFHAKFRVPVSKDDFDTEIEMLQWIELNLHKTDFTSLDQAKAEWQPISNSLENSFNNNQELFQFISTSDHEISMYYFKKWVKQTTSGGDTCSEDLDACELKVLGEFVEQVSRSEGGNVSMKVFKSAFFFYGEGMKRCADNFEECVANS